MFFLIIRVYIYLYIYTYSLTVMDVIHLRNWRIRMGPLGWMHLFSRKANPVSHADKYSIWIVWMSESPEMRIAYFCDKSPITFRVLRRQDLKWETARVNESHVSPRVRSGSFFYGRGKSRYPHPVPCDALHVPIANNACVRENGENLMTDPLFANGQKPINANKFLN